ncbi:MAG: DUF1616 domain-containing protein [Methanolobus sp.]
MDMKKLVPDDLLIVIAFTLLTSFFVILPFLSENPLRIVFGLLMVLFLPGYALIAALFPGKEDLDGIERLSLSFGLSIAVVPLIGLVLNYTPWGIRLVPILVSLTIFTLSMVAVAVYRRQQLGSNAFSVPFMDIYESIESELTSKPESKFDQALTIILVLSILLAAVTLVYVVVTPKQGEKFTEFYILGPDGMADNYSTQLVKGEKTDVIVGIVNHEYSLVNYSVVIKLDEEEVDVPDELKHIALNHNETWEVGVSFAPAVSGDNMKLQYLLFREDNMTESYRDLHLWINVSEPWIYNLNDSNESDNIDLSLLNQSETA